MISPVIKLFTSIGGLLIIYAIPCFLAHYLDFGWKFSTGEWLHVDFRLLKQLRSGLFHKVLIGLILIILLYAGLSEVLTVMPADWGQMDSKGQFQSYRRLLAVILAIVLGVVTMCAFKVAETHFAQKNKETRKESGNDR